MHRVTSCQLRRHSRMRIFGLTFNVKLIIRNPWYFYRHIHMSVYSQASCQYWVPRTLKWESLCSRQLVIMWLAGLLFLLILLYIQVRFSKPMFTDIFITGNPHLQAKHLNCRFLVTFFMLRYHRKINPNCSRLAHSIWPTIDKKRRFSRRCLRKLYSLIFEI